MLNFIFKFFTILYSITFIFLIGRCWVLNYRCELEEDDVKKAFFCAIILIACYTRFFGIFS